MSIEEIKKRIAEAEDAIDHHVAEANIAGCCRSSADLREAKAELEEYMSTAEPPPEPVHEPEPIQVAAAPEPAPEVKAEVPSPPAPAPEAPAPIPAA